MIFKDTAEALSHVSLIRVIQLTHLSRSHVTKVLAKFTTIGNFHHRKLLTTHHQPRTL